MDVTAVITAHNEADNIGDLLRRVLEERVAGVGFAQVVVVSSGSTDGTDDLVREVIGDDPRVSFLIEPERRGKNAAINLALEHRRPGDVIVLISGDVLPESGALTRLVAQFEDETVGMVGGRPVPVNDRRRFFGFAAHLLWAVHHHVATESPKLGELVAFRDRIEAIPAELAVDEAAIEGRMREAGLRLVYVPDAVIRNRGSENLRDFLSQRRRITAGHLHLEKNTGYTVATSGYLPAARGLLKELSLSPRTLLFSAATAALCVLGRLLGMYDFYVARRSHRVWDIARSTKGSLNR